MKNQLVALAVLAGAISVPSAYAQHFQGPSDLSEVDLYMFSPDAHVQQSNSHALDVSRTLDSDGRTATVTTSGTYQTDEQVFSITLGTVATYSATGIFEGQTANSMLLIPTGPVKLTIDYNYDVQGFNTTNRLEISILDQTSAHYYVQNVYNDSASGSFTVDLPNTLFTIHTGIYSDIEPTIAGTYSSTATVSYTYETLVLPEPTTVGLMVVGAGALLYRLRKRR